MAFFWTFLFWMLYDKDSNVRLLPMLFSDWLPGLQTWPCGWWWGRSLWGRRGAPGAGTVCRPPPRLQYLPHTHTQKCTHTHRDNVVDKPGESCGLMVKHLSFWHWTSSSAIIQSSCLLVWNKLVQPRFSYSKLAGCQAYEVTSSWKKTTSKMELVRVKLIWLCERKNRRC